MVKYLSDNKSDPRFQTILSKPQPFQATVAEERYPVDEVDLSKSLSVIQDVGNAYFRQQGEEQERERMGLSFEMYQANRAEQQTRQAAAEKEKGLKNTMLNDYAIAVSRLVLDPYMQDGPDKLSPVAAERKLRDLREQYIKMTGGVLNASDLMKIEKDSGVTFTKDLYNADLQRQNKAWEQQQKDYRETTVADYDAVHPGDNSTIPFEEKALWVSKRNEMLNGLMFSASNDLNTIANSQNPNMTNGTYISEGASKNLAGLLADSLEIKKLEGYGRERYWNATELYEEKQRLIAETANIEVATPAGNVKLGNIYGTDIIESAVNNAWVKSGIERPYDQEQEAFKQTIDEQERQNKYDEAKYVAPQELINRWYEAKDKQTLRQLLGPSSVFFSSNTAMTTLTNLMSVDPKEYTRVKEGLLAAMNSNAAVGKIDGISTGEAFAETGKKIGLVDKNGELYLSNVAVDNTKNILNGTGDYSIKPTTRWDIGSAIASMQNRDTILLNGNEQPSSEAAEAKEQNTKMDRNLYIKYRNNKDWWNSTSSEDREKLTRIYTTDTNVIAKRNLGVLREEGLAENIAFDRATNRFVPVNLNESAGSQKQTRLFSVIDTLNNLSHSGFEELDKGLVDNLLARDYGGTPVIRELTKEDKIVPTSSTVEFAKALYGGDYGKAGRRALGAWREGVFNAMESLSEGAKWVGENAVSAVIDLGIFGDKQLEKNGEAVADVVDFITNPDRTIKDEFEKAKNNTIDAFADVVLKGEDMTKEEKQQAKEEFKEQVKAAKNLLTKGELFEDGFGSGIGWEVPGKNTTVNWSMPGKGLLSGLQNILEDSSVKWEMPGKKLFSVLKNIFVGRRDLPTIPPYNAGIITRIMQEDETVTPKEANAALTAYDQASMQDKMRLNADFNIGYLDKNVEQRLKEATESKKKKKVKDL